MVLHRVGWCCMVLHFAGQWQMFLVVTHWCGGAAVHGGGGCGVWVGLGLGMGVGVGVGVGIKHQASSIKHQASSIEHQASHIIHQASNMKHQAHKPPRVLLAVNADPIPPLA